MDCEIQQFESETCFLSNFFSCRDENKVNVTYNYAYHLKEFNSWIG